MDGISDDSNDAATENTVLLLLLVAIVGRPDSAKKLKQKAKPKIEG